MELDWDALVAEMVAIGGFHPVGLDARTLKRDYEEGRAVIRTKGSRIIAYAAVEDRTSDPQYPTYEIRRVFVAAEKNGNGTARGLIEELIKRFTPSEEELPKKTPTFFLISKNPVLWHIAFSLGFRMVTKHRMPHVREWARRAGIGKRLPRSATRHNVGRSNRRSRLLLIR